LGTAPIALPGGAAQMRVRPVPHATRRPDYVIVAESGLGVRLMVVECKGASSNGEKSIDQLGGAMHQLAAIRFRPSRGTPRPKVVRHAYAALLARHGGPVELYGVDPEEPGEPWIEPARQRSDRPIATVTDDGHVVVRDAAALASELLRCVRERAAAWAGVGADPESDDASPLQRRASRFGDLIGAESRFQLPAGRCVSIFTGALADALRVARSPADAEEPRMGFSQRLGEIDERLLETGVAPLAEADEREHSASVISDSGLVLEIRVD
jgi:hypothetical protein